MDPIKNNGTMDYTMTMPQQNNVQQTPEEDYSSMPMVYDPTMDEKKESAKSGIALKALAAVGIAGLAMWAGHSMGQKGVKAAKEAEDLAVKAKDEALAKAKKLQEANDAAYEIADKKHTGFFDGKKALREDIKKALRPDEAEAKKATETAEKGAKEVEAKAEDAAEKATEETK